MKLEFHPSFKSDLEEATGYYLDGGGRDLAEAFVEQVGQALREIESQPLRFSFDYGDVRRARLCRFRAYAIRYAVDESTGTVFVGSLLHGARHPDCGKSRF